MTDDSAEDPLIADALAKIATVSPAIAEEAKSMFDALTWGEGLESVIQYGLQEFLWYTLPTKFFTETPKEDLASALGMLFDALEMPRYALICTSDTTRAVLGAFTVSRRKGIAALRRAEEASGLKPPDLPEFTWGDIIGSEEARAQFAIATYLEMATTSGELTPGTKGWKATQAELVRAQLMTPRIELAGQSYFQAITTERLDMWVRGRGSATWRSTIGELPRRLLHPIELPEEIGDPVRPFRWVLQQIGDGAALTQTGNLNQKLVQEAAKHFGWWPDYFGPPRTEGELGALSELRVMAEDLKLLRSTTKTIALTKKGAALVDDREGLWRCVAKALLDVQAFDAMVGEVMFAMLIDTDVVKRAAVEGVVMRIAEEEGWRSERTGQGPDRRAIGASVIDMFNRLRSLELGTFGDEFASGTMALTPAGKVTALEALRARGTGPRSGLQ